MRFGITCNSMVQLLLPPVHILPLPIQVIRYRIKTHYNTILKLIIRIIFIIMSTYIIIYSFPFSIMLFGIQTSVEGCHSRLSLHPDCLLYTVGFFLQGRDLAMHVLGKFAKGLVESSTTECIILL